LQPGSSPASLSDFVLVQKLLPPPERSRAAPQKSREHPQKRHRTITAGKSATCHADQNSSSPSTAISRPVASPITSINMTVNISSNTLLVTAATSNSHLPPHDGARDVKCGDSHTSIRPPTSNPQKGPGTEPSRPSIPSTPQTFTPALSTPTLEGKCGVLGQMPQTDSPPASPQPLIPLIRPTSPPPPDPPLTHDSQSTLVPSILPSPTPPPPTPPPPHHTSPKRRAAPQARGWFQSIRDFYEGGGKPPSRGP
jgi:hypothetical protein